MATQSVQWLSPEEYLKRERATETKSEYLDGTLVAMPGATPSHVLITVNIAGELRQQFKGRPCRVYTQDLRVRIAEGSMYAYPDVVAVCGDPSFETDQLDVLTNPALIVEVLSETTEAYDRGLKFAHYRQRASLKEYVLVAQDRISVEHYVRQGEQWVLTEATSLDDSIELPSIGCTLALRDVYEKVEKLHKTAAPDA
ncbi:MAG: Uma2 family endonuclease [Chloroflexi bacterium]|nr:Uma2 family endonuclease [Chloroflexota bacterium]